MIVALVVACAFFMETFTGTVITTALPAMARSFASDPVQLSLGVTSYMLSLAVFIPLSGWVADRYGARTVFRAAILVFTVASVLCGISNGLLELVAARVAQGVGGAMMVPVGRLVLLRSVDRSQIVRAMAYVTVPAFIGPVLGPPVGGFLTTYFTWRWVFFLNVPIGLVGMALVTWLIEDYREPATPPLDWLGFALSGVSLASLLYSLDLASRALAGSSRAFLFVMPLGLALGVLAVLHARRHPYPLIDLSLLRLPTFAAAVWGGLFFRMPAGSLPYLLPVLLQIGFGMTAFVSGMLILGHALGNIAMNAVAPALIRRFGFRNVMVWNGALSAAAIAGLSLFGQRTPAPAIFIALFSAGLVTSLQYNALSSVQYAEIPARNMSAATSLASMVQQLCNGTGIAFGALLLQATLALRGAGPDELSAPDLRRVLIAAGAVVLVAIPVFRRLRPDAGADLSGHRR